MGRTIQTGRLYRGASLSLLDDEGMTELRRCDLRTLVDLRTPRERELDGLCELDGAEAVHQSVLRDAWQIEPAPDELLPPSYFTERYLQMLEEGRRPIADALNALARPGALPAAIFCTAGKDRTSVLVALVLDLLGVDRDEIAADYHLTESMIERVDARWGAPAEAMSEFLDRLDSTHDGTRGYLTESGVPAHALNDLEIALTLA